MSDDLTPPHTPPPDKANAMPCDPSPLQALEDNPRKFSFFLALRHIEAAAETQPRLGESLRPTTDPVRLTQTPSLSFAHSTLDTYQAGQNGEPATLSSFFLGLFGPNGALPTHLTEHAKDRLQHHNDPTFAAFVDLFHHRMLSLFYRAWANNEPTVQFDRADADPFKHYVGALFGQGLPAYNQRDALPDRAKLYFSGLFSNQLYPADGLAAILSGYLNIPVTVDEFIGEWMPIPAISQWRLGTCRETGTLGQSTLLGEHVWGCQNKFRLSFGPLLFSEFKRLLPNGADLKRVVAIVNNYVGLQFAWDCQLTLPKKEVPAFVLDGGNQLGWSTWLLAGVHADDPDTQYQEENQIIKVLVGGNHYG